MSAEILAEDGFAGRAVLKIGTGELDVQVELRGFFQPIDGRYHWHGRIAADDRIGPLVTGGRAAAVLDAGHGPAPCELSEPDLWGRYRVTGQSTPPFPVAAAAGPARA